MKFAYSARLLCQGCGKPKKQGWHAPCSKKLQAQGGYAASNAPKLRSPRATEDFVKRVSKL